MKPSSPCLLFLLLVTACASAGKTPVESVAPRPADVATIDGIVRAFYEVVNIAPDQPRMWARDRTLYVPWVRFVAIGRDADVDVWTHQQLVDETEPLIQSGFRERELHRRVRRYGNIVHIDSTYQADLGQGAASRRQRGVNSLELYFDGTRWWIASVMWQSETEEHPIPPELLP